MKNLVLALLLAVGVTTAFGQTIKQPGALKSAIEKSDKQIVDAKKKVKVKTWITRGTTYLDIIQLLSQPENVLKMYKVAEAGMPPKDECVAKADEAFVKALELDKNDPKKPGKFKEKIYKLLADPDIQKNTLKRAYLIQGQDGFESKDFEKAMKAFIRSTEIGETVNYIDTAAYFNAAVAANNAKNSEVAVKFYRKAADLGYEGSKTYAYMAKAMANTADSVNIAKVLQDGIEKFPKSNQALIDELIDYYLRTGKTDEAMEFLDVAIKKNPTKHIYHYVKGTLFDKQGKVEEARVAYEKTSELKPDFYAAQFNIGVLYYNIGRNYLLEAQEIPPRGAANQKKYDDLTSKANVEIKKSLPYFEKAYSIAPDDLGTMQALKEVYYKLKMMDKYNEIKAKLEK